MIGLWLAASVVTPSGYTLAEYANLSLLGITVLGLILWIEFVVWLFRADRSGRVKLGAGVLVGLTAWLAGVVFPYPFEWSCIQSSRDEILCSGPFGLFLASVVTGALILLIFYLDSRTSRDRHPELVSAS